MKDHKIRILLVENIHPVAKDALEKEGYHVDMLAHAPTEEELIKILPGYDALGIRSKTEITKKVLDSVKTINTIGCFVLALIKWIWLLPKDTELLCSMRPIRTPDQ